MRRGTKVTFLGLGAVVLIGIGFAARLHFHGISARDQPTRAEEVAALAFRHFAIPATMRKKPNPVPSTPDVLRAARAHFADHCASCHGNDGKGQTDIGRNLYPKAPDMTMPRTQGLSDGELFAIIKNGIRLSGMPAFGSNSADDDASTWTLIHLIRHFPSMTAAEIEEMEGMNPVSPEELAEREQDEAFLSGKDGDEPEVTPRTTSKHAH